MRTLALVLLVSLTACTTAYEVKLDVYAFAAGPASPAGPLGDIKAAGHYVLKKKPEAKSPDVCELTAGGDLARYLAGYQAVGPVTDAVVSYFFWYDDQDRAAMAFEGTASLREAAVGRFFLRKEGESVRGPPHGLDLSLEAPGMKPLRRSFRIGREPYQEYILVALLRE